jgi:O-antigen ligase
MSRASPGARLAAGLRSPLLPVWLGVALLPFGRSAELATLLALLGCIMLFARQPRALLGHPGARLLLWLWGAYVLAALVSAFAAVRPGHSWATTAGLLRFAPLGLYTCFALRRRSLLEPLLHATAAVVALWVLDAWVQILTGWSLGGHADATRITGIFGAGNLKLGPALAVLSPLPLWSARRLRGRLGLVLAYLLMLGPVLLAGERAAWLMYAVVGTAFAWREARSRRQFVAWCGGALLAGTLAVALAWQLSPRFDARMQRTLLVLQGSSQAINAAASGRLDIWRVALRMFAAHPLTGVGVRDFRYAYPHYAASNDHFVVAESCGPGQGACHPHQLLLEVATDTGLVGLALWLAAAVLALRFWRRAEPDDRERAFAPAVALLAMLFPLNSHLAFYSAWWGFLFWWLLALWCAALTTVPDARFAAPPRPRPQR